MLLLLLLLPGEEVHQRYPVLWNVWLVAICTAATAAAIHAPELSLPLEAKRAARLIGGGVLVFLGIVVGFVLGKHPGRATPPFMEVVKATVTKIAVGISYIVALAFFWSGIEEARTLGSRLSTAAGSLTLTVLGAVWVGMALGEWAKQRGIGVPVGASSAQEKQWSSPGFVERSAAWAQAAVGRVDGGSWAAA